jgi:hypothetical protein
MSRRAETVLGSRGDQGKHKRLWKSCQVDHHAQHAE